MNSQGRLSLPAGEVALDGAEFVAGDRVLDAQAALEASDPQPRPIPSTAELL
jgi:hypothetical protein